MLPYFQHWSNQAHPAQFQRLYAYRHRVWTKVLPSQHGAFVGVQSSSGALKHLALKYKSEMFNCILPINSHTQRFAVTVSFRRKLLTLRQLYPRVPSQPSVLPCRMGRTSTSTTLMTQLVQAAILPPHVMLENIYIIDQNFCSFLN